MHMFMLFKFHESIYNLPLDLPHPCYSSTRCREVKWYKNAAFLALTLFLASLGNQRSVATSNPLVEKIPLFGLFSDTYFLEQFHFTTLRRKLVFETF